MNYVNYKELSACTVAIFLSLYMGIASGFSTEYIYQLGNEVKVEDSTASWIGGSGFMLTFIGCLVDGYLMDKFGRKSLLYSSFAIHAIGWMIIAKTKYFIAGRVLVSFAMGVGFAATVYIAEIIRPQYRGTFSMSASAFEILGSLFVYLLEYYISAQTAAFLLSILAIILFFCVFFIPESPYWFLLKREKENAIKSLVWLRDGNELTIDFEINHIEDNLEESCQSPTYAEVIFTSTWWETFALFSMYIVLIELTGFDMIIPYSVQFFAVINRTNIDNRIVSILFVTVAFVGTIITMVFVDRINRKTIVKNANLLNFVLLMMAGVCLTYSLWSPFVSFICLICFFIYSTTVASTAFTLPWTIISESLPTESRATLFAALSAEFSLIYFFIVKLFPDILTAFAINHVVFAFAFFSLLNYIFIVCCIKETKGTILPGNRTGSKYSRC